MKKLLLPVAWSLSILLLAVLASAMSGESDHFYGIADNKEQTIRFEMPVEIVRTLVVEGETAKQGDLLMEVRNEGLQSSLAIIEDELQELKSLDEENIATLNSRLLSLTAKMEVQRADMDSQINSLKSRYELNKDFLKQLSESDHENETTGTDEKLSPLREEIKGLQSQRQHLMASLQAEIDNIKLKLSASERPVDARIEGLKEKKKEALRKLSTLRIRANSDGRVGSILFKTGETVSPYQPILTIHGSCPSFVKAYINENVINKIKLRQTVWIQSSTSQSGDVIIEGIVESLGSRIVEYPERLRKNPLVSAWGREVIIHIEETSSLLMGEKVIVQLKKPASLFASLFTHRAEAAAVNDSKLTVNSNGIPVYSKADTARIFSDNTLPHASHVEASGILKDPDGAGYLLIGDEAKNDILDLYRLDETGEITERVDVNPSHNNMPKIDDLESISSDGEYIYVCASLSHNKQHELKNKRRRLIRLERQGPAIAYRDYMDLYEHLEKLSRSSGDTKTRRFLKHALASRLIDIEAHSVINGDLYIGFKSPANANGEVVILNVGSVDGILSGELAEGRIWQTVNLKDRETGKATVLSDMLAKDGKLLLLSVNEDRRHPSSHLWSLDPDTGNLFEMAVFSDLKAEGITRSNQGSDEYMVVFDSGGGAASRYMKLKTGNRKTAGNS